jgi:hypothetical protein
MPGCTSLKGQCQEIFALVFFIKHFLLVPLDSPRKDFKFFRIFEELFVFIIDSLCIRHRGVDLNWFIEEPRSQNTLGMNTPGCHDFLVYSSLGIWDFPVYSPPGSRPKLVYKTTPLVQNTHGSQDSPVINTLESLDSLVYYSSESFFVNLF